MAISETKVQMVIANYFKDECDVNTSIRQAFEKGFRIGVKKGASTNRPQGEWKGYEIPSECSVCGHNWDEYVFGQDFWHDGSVRNYCPHCGADMRGDNDGKDIQSEAE